MSSKTEALEKLRAFFEKHRIRYMVIGGLANMVWGRPRLQYDADAYAYVLGWLKESADALERPEILARYRRLRARVGA